MSLRTYRAKRDATRTPEPVPSDDGTEVAHTGDDQAGRGDRFVIQEHHATALHWDVRLQRDGVLVSWAVPKGVPLDPATNHLAKRTEDHPESYEAFSGDIPDGEYGAGSMHIWDRGTYDLEKWSEREVKLVLHGDRVQGRYVFFRTRSADWMLHRMDPPPAGWSPVPADLRPMHATDGSLPTGDGWSYEVNWGGIRVLVAVDGGRLRITDRDGTEVTPAFPELRGLGLQLGSRQALLDGEVVAFNAAGRADAGRLRARTSTAKPTAAVLRSTPVQLVLFDLLHLQGRSLLARSYTDRRGALESLGLGGAHWQVPEAFDGDGAELLAAARAQGLAGILAKRRNSSYEPGQRTDDWLAITG